MAVFSRLLAATTRPIVRVALNNGKSSTSDLVQRHSTRFCSDHHRIMEITPSKWSWHKCKDELHLYFWGAAIPVFVFIHLVNIFIGPAELAETPEGYVPEYYEYYSHPITRWLAKYVYSDHQANYERAMHHLQQEFEKTQMRRIEAKVNLLQKQRGDYMGNFYIPTDAYKYTQVKVYERENLKEGYGRVD